MADTLVSTSRAFYQCKSCERKLSPNDFYLSNQSKCKDCVKLAARLNRAAKVDYYRAYDAKRYQNDPRVKQRHRRYSATEGGKAAFRRARQKWITENPEKRAAHTLVRNGLRDGTIRKSEICQGCGCNPKRLEGHHEDYSKPLDVEWLCRLCHVDRHRGGE